MEEGSLRIRGTYNLLYNASLLVRSGAHVLCIGGILPEDDDVMFLPLQPILTTEVAGAAAGDQESAYTALFEGSECCRRRGCGQGDKKILEKDLHFYFSFVKYAFFAAQCDGDKRKIRCAPVAQLDRVPGYEPGGRGFESCLAHHQKG